ncbi:hypothetical protein A6R68_23990, partial [Neotoma lepida]
MQFKYVNLHRGNKLKIIETNLTLPMEFVLLGFSDTPKLHWFLFGIFLFIYIIILLGNGIIILITRVEPTLQTPMYFFISNFSFLEICYVSVTLPRMLMDLFTLKGSISFFACAIQMCLFLILGATECFLLAVMAYDRYVAICNPLHYPVVMSHKVCTQLVAGSWVIGIPIQVGQTYQILSLPFCKSNQINHFFCDIPPLLKLACGNIFVNEIVVFVFAVLIVTVPFMLILASYSRIISTILKLPSNTGRTKAFSTCSSHLIVVFLFYGSASITYLKPKSSKYEGTDKLLSLFYTILTPVFNPLIYSLRNKDVTGALRKLFTRLVAVCFLLTVIAVESYVAICKPLIYVPVMKHKVYVQMQLFLFGSLLCNSYHPKNAYGSLHPKRKYFCACLCNTNILCNIMKLSSAKGRAKAFSTCSSHLIVVVLFYGTASITYLQPKPNQSEGMGKLLSLFYTILIPALNPLIYTLRNKDIMMALRKLQNKLLT